MKLKIILFFSFAVIQLHSQSAASMKYLLSLFEQYIHVELTIESSRQDSLIFTYGNPAFGGQNDIFKGLQNFKIEQPIKYFLDSNERKIIIFPKEVTPLNISYNVFDTRSADNTRNQLFRPMIMTDYFYIHGINLFLTPESSPNQKITVAWKTRPPFKIFYAFDPDNEGTQMVRTTIDSSSLRFITGAKDLLVKKFTNVSGDNFLVVRTESLSACAIKKVTRFYKKYNQTLREYWNDNRKIQYSLVLQPFQHVHHAMSGVSFGNGFIGKYNQPDSLTIGERKFVVAHEIGHYYLGGLQAENGRNYEGQWFNEGFNDYTTYFNLLRSNEMKSDEFIKGLNSIIQKLYKSPIKNTPNDKIFDNFWKLGDYSKLPYWRGCIYAFYLDNQISIQSNNRFCIRNLELDLQDLVRNRDHKEFSNEEFVQAVAKYLPDMNQKELFNDYIVQGISIPFNTFLNPSIFKATAIDGIPKLEITNNRKFRLHFKKH